MTQIAQKAQLVYHKLKKEGKTIATAESCTGGMIGKTLTEIPGVSEVYGYGFITYSNEAKNRLLNVDTKILDTFGAVSAETVCAMATGALEVSGADLAISCSGIAGPGGGTKEKKVGLVYVGLAKKGEGAKAFEFNFAGDRQSVREQTVLSVFDIILNN